MEIGDKIKELNMTKDEVDRFSAAFKDEKFRGLLLEYAKELSDPECKKKYEEEIKLLEEERGNAIEFIHPQPFRALKTSVNGKQKCFVNICANEKVGKCEFKWGVSDDGKRGQHWSLPHSLHPGRPERDPKGNKFMIYDVIFHPDTIHMASKNREFMDMVDSTAIQGIQDGFKVRLDQNNVKVLATKYKGTPQPSVIRKPIPGYQTEDPPASPDPLAFPFPYKDPPSGAANQPAAGAKTREESTPRSFVTESPKPGAPTTPHYKLKYRSFIDLQDFRCSRDSAQSPRPGEIVVTVDMPLLKSAKDTSLEVLGKTLRVECKRPAYRLELPLAYPVDEDRGGAKFNTQNGQLTITLPVSPLVQTVDLSFGPRLTEATQNGEIQNRTSEMDEQEELEKEETEQKNEGSEGQRERGVGPERESADAREVGGCDTEEQAGSPRRKDVPTTHVASYTEDNPSETADNRNGVPPHTQKSFKVLEDNTGENSGTSESSFHSRNSKRTEADEETGTPEDMRILTGTLTGTQREMVTQGDTGTEGDTGIERDTGTKGDTGTCAEKEHLQGTSSTEYTAPQLVSDGKSTSSEATGSSELLNSEDRNHQMSPNVPTASAEDQLKKDDSADSVPVGPVSATEEEEHQEDSADTVPVGPASATEEEEHQEDSADTVPVGPVSATEEEEHQEDSADTVPVGPASATEEEEHPEDSADTVPVGPVSATEEEEHQEDSADAVPVGPASATEEEEHQEDSADTVPVGPASATEEEEHQEDSPPGQNGSEPVFSRKPPQPLLREMDESGQETIISDHATSAGLSFHNSLLYELD
ncbi:unnamed protein product [Gadus morhua 'NCC']